MLSQKRVMLLVGASRSLMRRRLTFWLWSQLDPIHVQVLRAFLMAGLHILLCPPTLPALKTSKQWSAVQKYQAARRATQHDTTWSDDGANAAPSESNPGDPIFITLAPGTPGPKTQPVATNK